MLEECESNSANTMRYLIALNPICIKIQIALLYAALAAIQLHGLVVTLMPLGLLKYTKIILLFLFKLLCLLYGI